MSASSKDTCTTLISPVVQVKELSEEVRNLQSAAQDATEKANAEADCRQRAEAELRDLRNRLQSAQSGRDHVVQLQAELTEANEALDTVRTERRRLQVRQALYSAERCRWCLVQTCLDEVASYNERQTEN